MSRSTRKGFSMLETAVVMGLTATMALVGYTTSQELLPRFRTRQAAMEFARTLELARQLAVTSNQETRVLLVEFDGNALDKDSPNRGQYRLQVGNKATASTIWDTLPYESGVVDDKIGEGTFDISKGGNDYLRGVSMEDWGIINGPSTGNSDAIVFSPRGTLQNPSSDFDDDGTLQITFVNKFATNADGNDRARIRVFRGGMVRFAFDGEAARLTTGGTGFSSTVDDSEGDGYVDIGDNGGVDTGGTGDPPISEGGDDGDAPKDIDDDVDEIIREAIDALDGDSSSDDDSDDESGDDSSGDDESGDDGSDDDDSYSGGGGDDSSDDSSGDDESGDDGSDDSSDGSSDDDESDDGSSDDDESDDDGSDDGSDDSSSDDESDDGSSDDDESDDGSDDGSSDDESDGGSDDDQTIDEYLEENGLDREDLYEDGATDEDIEEYFGNDGVVDEDDRAKAESDCGCSSSSPAGRTSSVFLMVMAGMFLTNRRGESEDENEDAT